MILMTWNVGYQETGQETIFGNQFTRVHIRFLTGLFLRLKPVRKLLHPLEKLEVSSEGMMDSIPIRIRGSLWASTD